MTSDKPQYRKPFPGDAQADHVPSQVTYQVQNTAETLASMSSIQFVWTIESNPAKDLVGVVVESRAELPAHLCLLERDMDPVRGCEHDEGNSEHRQ